MMRINSNPLRTGMRSQGGAGLLEVLAALFVLSVGMLGIAGLQISGLQAGKSATTRTIVLVKAQEILERMRANSLGVFDAATATSAYNVGAGAGVDKGCDDRGGGTPAVDCSVADLAATDIFHWHKAVSDALSDASTNININTGATPPVVTVQINWRRHAGAPVESYMTQTVIQP